MSCRDFVYFSNLFIYLFIYFFFFFSIGQHRRVRVGDCCYGSVAEFRRVDDDGSV